MFNLPQRSVPSDRTRLVLAGICLLLGSVCCSSAPSVRIGPPPASEERVVADLMHGESVEDRYRWLEEQQSPETRAWIESQNAYTDSVLSQLPGSEELRRTAEQLLKTDSISPPTVKGGRYFFSRRRADQELSILYMRQGADGEDQVLIDPHEMSSDHTTSVGFRDISEDGRLVVYAVRQGGVDEVEIRFRDVDSGADLADVMPADRYGSLSLKPDKSGIYYSKYGRENPRIYYHALGSDVAEDEVLFGEGLAKHQILSSSLSDDGDWLLAHVIEGSSGPTEIHLKNLKRKIPFQKMIADARSRSFAGFAGDRIYIRTDLDAPNGRVMTASLDRPQFENWKEIIPEQEKRVLRGVSALGGKLFVTALEDVRTTIDVYDLEGTRIRDIAFETIGTVGIGSGDWKERESFLTFSSFHIPQTIYRYDVETGERDVWASVKVPVDTQGMEVEQVWYDSSDGTKIPMFLVHRKDLERNGTTPTLLTGYGGFNISLTPRFSGAAAAWVQEGGLYAVPNLRGGGEFGEDWHKSGMMEKKQNVFDDFIAAAEYLISEGYTRSQSLAVQGGSNGGLLVGAVLTQRPDLVGAVVCTYPLLDMLRYHKLLVGSFWISEYGSSDDSDQYRYLKAYSPYHNVEDGGRYPATLFVTGDGDTRVDPSHARKMTALVQSCNRSENPIMLRYHTKAGHSGGQPVNQRIDQLVEVMTFLKWRLGDGG